MKRNQFLKGLALAGVAGSSMISKACKSDSTNEGGKASPAKKGKKYRWKMVTTWPPKFPILGEGAELLAEWIEEMSDGRLKIRVYGGGELVPPLEAFDAVSRGTADMSSGAAYYWAGKAPAAQFFAGVPFGMNAQQTNAWLIGGGGLDLWEELYAQYDLIPMVGGSTGVQVGGWFNKRIDTVDDLKGLKMRMPGLGAKVLEKAGGAAVLSPGSEIYTNLERGVIDATEWIGPYHDYKMGFHKIAKYCYYPGWHEPGTMLEIMINKPTFEKLPKDLQAIVRAAVARLNIWTLAQFEAQNANFLQKLKEEGDVEFLPFPSEVLSHLKALTQEVLEEVTANDEMSKKVYESYKSFRAKIQPWGDMTEKVYYSW